MQSFMVQITGLQDQIAWLNSSLAQNQSIAEIRVFEHI